MIKQVIYYDSGKEDIFYGPDKIVDKIKDFVNRGLKIVYMEFNHQIVFLDHVVKIIETEEEENNGVITKPPMADTLRRISERKQQEEISNLNSALSSASNENEMPEM